jgi:hypothetical protein
MQRSLLEQAAVQGSAWRYRGSRDVAGSYVVRPRVAFAWSEGAPSTFTRWVFDQQPPTRI